MNQDEYYKSLEESIEYTDGIALCDIEYSRAGEIIKELKKDKYFKKSRGRF